MVMRSEVVTVLTVREQQGLVQSIESAIHVSHLLAFQAWLLGPIQGLIAFRHLVCLEVDGHGSLTRVERIGDNGSADDSPDRQREADLAVLLSRTVAATSGNLHIADGLALRAMDALYLPAAGEHAVVFRTRYVSGNACYFVFFGVPQASAARSQHILNLLSSHLKTVWSRVSGLPCPEALTKAVLRPALTGREEEILRLMGEEKSNKEISQILAISPITLKNHITKIYRKLDVQNRNDAVTRGALRIGGHHPALAGGAEAAREDPRAFGPMTENTP